MDIPAPALVPGDLILLKRGALVPADARLVEADRLTVSEAALTGESLPVHKKADVFIANRTALAEKINMVFRGTVVTGGSGSAVVVATGPNTQIGRIQRLVEFDQTAADAVAATT